ncbi:hypothetical protein BN1232_04246 [Mycobacterium lentiflavum]|uniref:Uncharacterized protein n=1 Tax=Mycobacterium lentiflavum TaxID=141349 RepID=A0A0E4H2Z9_MYCLN|nr:hypothetical protein BN1232_04246 [Mycobacterium lentiflavum]
MMTYVPTRILQRGTESRGRVVGLSPMADDQGWPLTLRSYRLGAGRFAVALTPRAFVAARF